MESVTGKATVDGSPLTLGSVRFVPDPAKGNKATVEPIGQIGADGTYTLYTNNKAGAPPGWYKVAINATEIPDSSRPFSGKSLIAQKYNSPDSSGVSIEVKSSSKAGDYDLKLSSR